MFSMANEDAAHRCITKFMLDTCRYSTGEHTEVGFLIHTLMRLSDLHGEAFISGSSAEFRIKPMLPCIGDVDTMFTSYNILAIPEGNTPPTALPSHYEHFIFVLEIIDSQETGYIYLRLSHMLTKDDNGRYVVQKIQNNGNEEAFWGRHTAIPEQFQLQYLQDILQLVMNQEISNNLSMLSLFAPATQSHGPATAAMSNEIFSNVYKPTRRYLSHFSFDCVYCIHCILWPPLAASWPTRKRQGWPDQATINIVIGNGCDVVQSVHPRCRHDVLTKDYQWRLSFSRAEITLLSSWTHIQQIIYHMLRFVIKRELLSKTNDNELDLPTLSNYHIKTLMLWECEEKPQSWWSAESSLIKICSSLLHKLCDWVADKHCQHYFISNCNLIDHFQDASLTICSTMRYLADLQVLLSWFIENYIRKCALYCPAEVSIQFEDIRSVDKLESAVNALVNWKLSTLTQEVYEDHSKLEVITLSFVVSGRRDATGIQIYVEQLQNFDLKLRDFFVAVTSLRVAYTISMHSLTEDVLEILCTLFDLCADTATDKYEPGGLWSIRRAIRLATLSRIRSNASEMLHIEISKLYLHHALTDGLECTYCVVHVLLAALYYKSGHYQTAVTHCKQVLKQCDHDQYVLQKIGAEYLPHTDETVDSVFGLILLYQHVQRMTLALKTDVQLQPNSELAFTIQLFARYLHSKCSSVAEVQELLIYGHQLTETKEPLLSDALLFKATKMQLYECAEMSVVSTETEYANSASLSMDTTLLATMMELEALEKLTKVRHMVIRELHCELFPLLNEFEVLYKYRCGLFAECLVTCRNHVNMLLCAGCTRNQLYAASVPELVSLLDGELVSFFGFIKLMHPVLFLFLLQFPYCESISMITLCLYLMVQCQKKLRSNSVCDTFQLIRIVHDNVFPADDNEYYLDRLILKLTYRSLKLYVDDSTRPAHCCH